MPSHSSASLPHMHRANRRVGEIMRDSAAAMPLSAFACRPRRSRRNAGGTLPFAMLYGSSKRGHLLLAFRASFAVGTQQLNAEWMHSFHVPTRPASHRCRPPRDCNLCKSFPHANRDAKTIEKQQFLCRRMVFFSLAPFSTFAPIVSSSSEWETTSARLITAHTNSKYEKVVYSALHTAPAHFHTHKPKYEKC